LAALDRAAELGVDTGELHFGRAVLLYDAGALEAAAAAFMRAAEGLTGDDRCSARSNAAMVLRTLGRGDECLAAHRRNVEECPASHAAWYGLGLAEVKLGAYDRCVASITRALELDPADGNAHYTIACAYALRRGDGDDGRALEHVAAAIAAEPELRAAIADDDDFADLADDPRFRELIDG
ncbi:MAG: tetratricopeptide repeat protein, partial [Myxococcales bacterium]|nr:tetratricopeptide repeat protein [Myxococcales bacterium]